LIRPASVINVRPANAQRAQGPVSSGAHCASRYVKLLMASPEGAQLKDPQAAKVSRVFFRLAGAGPREKRVG